MIMKDNVCSFFVKTHVMDANKSCLGKAILMSIHIRGFYEEMCRIVP